jgi:hypothetical protein
VKSSSLFIVAIVLAGSACEPPAPVRTAAGELIESVSYEERFALSSDVKETSFHGDRLRRAVELMDRAGVTAMSGDYSAAGVVDKSTLIITVSAAGHRERKIVLRNCADPNVCKFFATAVQSGVVDKTPAVCRDAIACAER